MNDAELDLYLAQPTYVAKACKIYYLITVKKGFPTLKKVLIEKLHELQQMLVGESTVLRSYETITRPNHPLGLQALNDQLAISEARTRLPFVINESSKRTDYYLRKWQLPGGQVRKVTSASFALGLDRRPYQIHAQQLFDRNGVFQRFDDWKLKVGATDLRNTKDAHLYRARADLLKALTTDRKAGGVGQAPASPSESNLWVDGWQVIGLQAAVGGALSALLHIGLLLDGRLVDFAVEVGMDAAKSLLSSACGELLKHTELSAEWAGPLVGLGLSALFNTYALVKTGDWARFGINMAHHAAVSAVSTLVVKGTLLAAGAAIGTLSAPVTLTLMLTVGLLTSMGTSQVLKQFDLFGTPTQQEAALQAEQKAQLQAQRAQMAQELEKKGIILDSSTPEAEFLSKLEGQEIAVKGHDWSRLAADAAAATKYLSNRAFRECLRWVFAIAKVRSPSGDVGNGLTLLLADLETL